MARPTAPVHICNLALDELKQSPINSIDTPVTQTEIICARWYDMTRQETLRSHPFKFATKRRILTPNSSTTPSFGYTYAFDLPTDYIRLVMLGDDYVETISDSFEIENGQILTPSGSITSGNPAAVSLYTRYVWDITDVTRFDPLFIKVLVLQLASNMANKFAISSALKKSISEDLLEAEVRARAVNGQDRRPKRIQRSKILSKRRGIPGGVFASPYNIFDS